MKANRCFTVRYMSVVPVSMKSQLDKKETQDWMADGTLLNLKNIAGAGRRISFHEPDADGSDRYPGA
jgi:hypothetical protein